MNVADYCDVRGDQCESVSSLPFVLRALRLLCGEAFCRPVCVLSSQTGKTVSLRFAIVGAGKVGTALAKLLSDAGYEFAGAASRSIQSAEAACRFVGTGQASADAAALTCQAGLVFITTPDDAIGSVCERLVEENAFMPGSIVAHCSGALPSTVLESARTNGAHVGSMHPLQSFATIEQAVNLLPGSYCCIEGDPEAVRVLEQVAIALRAKVMVIPTESKTLYHAAAVMACNYLVALQNAALKLGQAAGIGRAEGLRALLPLIKGTVNNLEKVGIPQALTGPVARGDVETVRRHMEAIGAQAPELLPLYKLLGREAVEVALAKGTLNEDRAAELMELFQ